MIEALVRLGDDSVSRHLLRVPFSGHLPDYLQDVIREIGAAGCGEFNAVPINR
jgi:hypothetical protein